MEKNAVIISGDDLRFLIREAIRTELNNISRTTQPTPVPQEGGIEFAMGVIRVYAKSTIYKLTSEGKIPHTRRGKTLWFNRSDLEKWLADGASRKKKPILAEDSVPPLDETDIPPEAEEGDD